MDEDGKPSEQPTFTAPLAYSAQHLAERLGVSLRHVRRMDAAGMLPKPIRLGRAVRWPAEDIHGWLKAGSPDRRKWEAIKALDGKGQR